MPKDEWVCYNDGESCDQREGKHTDKREREKKEQKVLGLKPQNLKFMTKVKID